MRPSSESESMLLLLLVLLLSILTIVSCDTGQSLLLSAQSSSVRTQMFQLTFDLVEESPVNTEVCNLGSALWKAGHPALSNHPMAGPNFYQQLSPFLQFLRIERDNGSVFISDRVDREKLCPPGVEKRRPMMTGAQQKYHCIVYCQVMFLPKETEAASVNGPEIIRLNFRILDVNDNPPSWSTPSLVLEVPEHSPTGATFSFHEAVDPDQGPQNTTVSYQVVRPETTPEFELTVAHLPSTEWEPRKFALALRTQKSTLDREKQSNYSMTLLAVDGGSPPLTGTLNLQIIITDINDHAPQFFLSSSNVTLPEDFPIHVKFFQFTARDVDSSDQGKLAFQLSSSSGDFSVFQLNRTSGELSLRKSLDFETTAKYSLSISVTDGKHISSIPFLVLVENVNDNSPEISCQPLMLDEPAGGAKEGSQPGQEEGATRLNELSVKENLPSGAFIGSISVKDKDESNTKDAGTIRCHLTDGAFGLEPLFAASRNQYRIVTLTTLDREKQFFYPFQVICYDNGHPSRSSALNVQVVVLDDNDSTPRFSRNPIPVRLRENEASDVLLVQVQAQDDDKGVNAQLHYSLDSVGQRYFTIDSTRGIIKTKVPLDREWIETLQITVFVQDGPESLTSSSRSQDQLAKRSALTEDSRTHGNVANATIIITVEDENDCAPVFEQTMYTFRVREGTRRSHIVGQVIAKDKDATSPNNVVVYRLAVSHDLDARISTASLATDVPSTVPPQDFQVTHDGIIQVSALELDRERVSGYALFVVAEDQGSPPSSRLSSSVLVQIHIDDCNDNVPEWVFPNEKNRSVNVTFNSPLGYMITQLKAFDLDDGVNGVVSYKLLPHSAAQDSAGSSSSSGGGFFQLDAESGALYLIRSLSRQHIGLVKLYVEAKDHGLESTLFSTTVLEVNIVENLAASQKHSSSQRLMEMDLMMGIVLITVLVVISSILCFTLVVVRWRMCSFKRESPIHRERDSFLGDKESVGITLLSAPCESQASNGSHPTVIRNENRYRTNSAKVHSINLNSDSSPSFRLYRTPQNGLNSNSYCKSCEHHAGNQSHLSAILLNTLRHNNLVVSGEEATSLSLNNRHTSSSPLKHSSLCSTSQDDTCSNPVTLMEEQDDVVSPRARPQNFLRLTALGTEYLTLNNLGLHQDSPHSPMEVITRSLYIPPAHGGLQHDSSPVAYCSCSLSRSRHGGPGPRLPQGDIYSPLLTSLDVCTSNEFTTSPEISGIRQTSTADTPLAVASTSSSATDRKMQSHNSEYPCYCRTSTEVHSSGCPPLVATLVDGHVTCHVSSTLPTDTDSDNSGSPLPITFV